MTTRSFLGFAGFALFTVVAMFGCSDDGVASGSPAQAATATAPPMSPASAPDAGDDASSTSDASDARKRCSDLENAASPVDFIAVAEAPPAPEGGPIASGTYVLDAATSYTGAGGASGPTGEVRRMTMRVALPDVESIFDGVHRSATCTIDGTKLVTTSTCPTRGTDENGYTATPSTLSLWSERSSSTVVLKFVKVGS